MKAIRIFFFSLGVLVSIFLIGIGGYFWLGGYFYARNAPLFDALACTAVAPLYTPLGGSGSYTPSACSRGIYAFRGTPADIATFNSDVTYLNAVLTISDEAQKEEMLDFWLKRGANINIQNEKSGVGLVEMSAFSDDADNVRLLVKHGARVDVQNKLGLTPLEAYKASAEKIHKKPDDEMVKLLGG